MSFQSRQLTPRHVIRERGEVRMTAAGSPEGPCVVLSGLSDAGAARLESVRKAHLCASGPHVPAPIDMSDRGDSLVLRTRAVADLEQLYRELDTAPEGLPYGQGVAFNDWLMDALEAVHECGQALGALSWANILVTDEGGLQLVGLGDNFLAFGPGGVQLGVPGQCVAPELIAGEPATPTADVFVLHSLARSLLARTNTPLALREAVDGGGSIYRPLLALATDALAMSPRDRIPDVATLRRRYRVLRDLAPEIPPADMEGLRETLRSLVRRHTEAGQAIDVRLALRSRTVHLRSKQVDLSRRGPAWRILVALAERHVSRPGESMSTDMLVEAGWPEEQIRVDSGRARLYVAMSSLRKLGFDDVIAKVHDGYSICHNMSVRLQPE